MCYISTVMGDPLQCTTRVSDGFVVLASRPKPFWPCFHSKSLVCLFGVLRRFQHCTGHITTGSWKGRGNQYIEFARVVYCKLPTNGNQLPAFPLTAMTGIEPRPQRWEARVLPLCHRGPLPSPWWPKSKLVKVGVLRPVQQPGSYWDRSSELPLVGLEPTEVTAYD